MVSNQILQNTLEETAKLTGATAAFFDSNGQIIAEYGEMDEVIGGHVLAFVSSGLRELSEEAFTYYRATDEADTVYVLAVDNRSKNAEMTLRLLILQLEALINAYKERLDRDNFVKNLILDNLLQIDIYNKAKKLHIDFNVKRCVVIVESGANETAVTDIVRQYVSGFSGDYFTNVDESNLVIIHEVKNCEYPQQDLFRYASALQKQIQETGVELRVSYGAVVDEIREVSKSYKEAKLALDVGKIFFEQKNVVAYNNLGIGRLIYQLPLNLCRMFIKEIFGDKTPDQFDKETLVTINKFFENNLNVSETSRQLFIHRNTLVYRLDKIQKNTGLDLRAFDDAITFKIALMVVKYMDYMKKIDY